MSDINSFDELRNYANPEYTPYSDQKTDGNWLKNDFMAGVNKLNSGVENYVVAPALGAIQSITNTPSFVGNLGKHLAENTPLLRNLREEGRFKNLPDFPYFDVAPHTLPAQIGEMAPLIPGGKLPAELAEKGIKYIYGKGEKAWDYMHPERAAERYRSEIGEGTSKENIENLSQRTQFAKQSTNNQAIIPKDILHAQEGRSNVYDVNPKNLPEGNIPKFAQMIDQETARNSSVGKSGEFESQMSALSRALGDFRQEPKFNKEGKQTNKGGDTQAFLDRSEELFGIPDLPPKAQSKIEDALLIPTKRNSKYFQDEDVTLPYSKKGKMMELHNSYKENATLENYQALQSQLKKELRTAEGRAKVSDTAQPQVDQLKLNIKNLNSDKNSFMKTLPENMQNLDNEFRQQYRNYAETYEKGEAETGPSLTLRRLAEGNTGKVTDAAVVKLFSNPTAADKRAILDMGSSAAKNAIYAALQRVKPGDGEGIATTLLDLKRTKGFDEIITPEMEGWAHNMLTHVRRVEGIKKGLVTSIGASVGGLIGGPAGGVAGSLIINSPRVAKYIAEKFRK